MLTNILVVILGLTLIAGIIWWFFAPHTTKEEKSTTKDGKQNVHVVVDGGYKPQTVVLSKGVPATMTFERKDPSSCLSEVVLPDFGIRSELPLGNEKSFSINTVKAGEFDYACGMNMFHGKIIIK